MDDQKMRVGIVGCGGIAHRNHIPVWQKIGNIEIIAVCDKNEKMASNTAKKFGISRYYTDFAEIIEDTYVIQIV